MNAILDFQIVNFRSYDCSNTNCQIVELFLTVDTSRKMQNGVNIHVSIDRFEDFIFLLHKFMVLNFRGIDILKNDVAAILSQIFDLKFRDKRHPTMPPGMDDRIQAERAKHLADNTQ